MKKYLCALLINFLNKQIKSIQTSQESDGNIIPNSPESLSDNIRNQQYPNIKQLEVNSINVFFWLNKITIDEIAIKIDFINDILPQQISPESKKYGIFMLLLIQIWHIFLYMINFLFGKLILMINNFVFNIIRRIISNTEIEINKISIDLKTSQNNNNTHDNEKILLLMNQVCIKDVNTNELSFISKINKIDLAYYNGSNNLFEMNLHFLKINIEQMTHFSFDLESSFNVYFHLTKYDVIFDIIKALKGVFIQNDLLNQADMTISIIIPNTNIYMIKFNSPFLLLNIQQINFDYPFIKKDLNTKFEFEIRLIHLNDGPYNVINSSIITFNISHQFVNISIPHLHSTISCHFLKELFSEDDNNLLSLPKYYNDKLVLINHTKEKIIVKFSPNNQIILSKDPITIVNTNDNERDPLAKVNIQIEIDGKNYYFSISNLYSPFPLDNNLIVTLNSEKSVDTIHFSSIYVIENRLNYDIEVSFNDSNNEIIEKNSTLYVPYKIDFCHSQLKAVTYPSYSKSQIVNFRSTNPIKFTRKELRNHIQNENKDYYSACYLSYDPSKLMYSIIFEPYITITNYLPYEMQLTIGNNENILLKPEETLDMSFLNNYKSEIQLKLDLYRFYVIDETITLKKLDEFEHKINLKLNNAIIFKCSKIQGKNENLYHISIYSSFIIENKTGIHLSILNEKEEIEELQSSNKIFFNPKNKIEKDFSINLPLFFKNFTKKNKNEFRYGGLISQLIPIPLEMSDEVFFFVSFTKTKGKYENSSIITVEPYFKVHNEIEKTVIFYVEYIDKDTPKRYINECRAGDSIIKSSKKDGIFNFFIEGYQTCIDFNMFNLGCTSVKLFKQDDPNKFLLINFLVTKEKIGYCCNITNLTEHSTPSIFFENRMSNKKITIYQHIQQDIKGFEYHPMIVRPNKKKLFVKEQPFLIDEFKNKYYINISFDDDPKLYLLSFEEKNSFNIKDQNNINICFCNVLKDEKDNRIIIFNDHNNSKESSNDENVSKEKDVKGLGINFSIDDIQLSYLNQEKKEIFLVASKELILSQNESELKFKVQSFTLNDMFYGSISPVVLYKNTEKDANNNAFFDLIIKSKHSLKSLMLDEISLKVSPVKVVSDIMFIQDLYAALVEIYSYFDKISPLKKDLSIIFSTKHLFISKIFLEINPILAHNRKFRIQHPNYFKKYALIVSRKKYNFNFIEVEHFNYQVSFHELIGSLFEEYKNQISIPKLFISSILPSQGNEQIYKFDDFLKEFPNMQNDPIMKYPRRMPRPIIKGGIFDIPTILDNNNYPDIYTDIQYKFYANYPELNEYNEELHELFMGYGDSLLAIFDKYVFIYIKRHGKEKKLKLNIENTYNIENRNENLVFNDFDNYICKNTKDAKLIMNKVKSMMIKIQISKQLIKK